MNEELLQEVYKHLPKLLEREQQKDPHFHFGFKNWDDIQIEIFEHIYEKLSLYNKNRPLKPWLATIVKNQIINKKRDCSSRNLIENRQFTNNPQFFNYLGELNNNPAELTNKHQEEGFKQIHKCVQTVWKGLKFKDKKLAILYFKHGVSPYTLGSRYQRTPRHLYERIQKMKERLLREFQRNEIHIKKT